MACPSEVEHFWTAFLTVTSVHHLLATPRQRWRVQSSRPTTFWHPFLCMLHDFHYKDEEQEERGMLLYGCSPFPLLPALSRGWRSYLKPCLETWLLQFHKRTAWQKREKQHIAKPLPSCRCFLVSPYKYEFCSVSKLQNCWQRKKFSA